jgi:hypothetical protein
MLRWNHAVRTGTLFAALSGALISVCAADSAPTGDQDLRRKTQEVERLQQELERAQKDLRRLEQENEKLRQQPPTTVPLPSVEVTQLPPLQKGETADVRDLVAQFHSDPDAAGRRYDRQRFQVKGTIEAFELVLFESRYRVRLTSPTPEYQVTCGFYYGNRYQSVFRRHEGKELVGRIDDRAVQPILRVGQPVVIRGKCTGLKAGEIRFTGCELVR